MYHALVGEITEGKEGEGGREGREGNARWVCYGSFHVIGEKTPTCFRHASEENRDFDLHVVETNKLNAIGMFRKKREMRFGFAT